MEPISLIAAGTGLLSALGGLLSSGSSPQEEAMKQVYDMLKSYLPEMSKTPYSKGEIQSIVKQMQQMYRGASNVAAGQIGSAIGETGMPKGQGWGEYYTQALAPIIAEGQNRSANAEMMGVEAYSDMFNQAKSRTGNLLGTITQASSMLPQMTGGQKGMAGFLQTLNLLATGGGNFAEMWKNLNYKPLGAGGGTGGGGGTT